MSRRLGIYRRVAITQEFFFNIITCIQSVVLRLPKSAGYRTVHQRVKTALDAPVPRDVVMKAMRLLYPEDSAMRRKKSVIRRQYCVPGPNYMWHIDGYDKLKKFGLAIHGCVDGYSRKIMWLEVGPTNNNPRVVANFFVKTVLQLKGLPTVIRADRGTENVMVEKIQSVLRSFLHHDSRAKTSFLYGKSVLNQRIERLWGSLRQSCMQYDIDVLSGLERAGVFSTANALHIEAVRYCFTSVIRSRLFEFMRLWNQHRIRKRSRSLVSGIPEVLYARGRNAYLWKISPCHLQPFQCDVIEVDDVCEEFAEVADSILRSWEQDIVDDIHTVAIKKLKILITAIDRASAA